MAVRDIITPPSLEKKPNLWPKCALSAPVSIGTGTKHNISAANPKKACIRHMMSSHQVCLTMVEKHASQSTDSPYFRFDAPDVGTTVDNHPTNNHPLHLLVEWAQETQSRTGVSN